MPFVSERIAKVTLLRRICQQASLKIEMREYDFSSSAPFDAMDIIGVLPKVKTSEPDNVFPEAMELIKSSTMYLQEHQNVHMAYEMANEALSWINQVVGTVHKDAQTINDHIIHILLQAGDLPKAIQFCLQNLLVSAQVHGIDSANIFQHHLQLGILHQEIRQYSCALQHFGTAKYLLELLGGARHTEMGSLLIHLGRLCGEMNDFPQAIKCYTDAKVYAKDLTRHVIIHEALGEFYFANGDIDDALKEQRVSYKLYSELCGATDERTLESKSKVGKYLRVVTERNIASHKAKLALKAQQDEQEWLKSVEKAVVSAEKEESKGKNNGKKGKNKK